MALQFSDGHAIGIGSTNTTVGVPVPGAGSTSSLVNGGIYYVAKNSESNLSLAVTKQRAIDKKFLLDFVDDGSGTHTLTSTRIRKILDRIVLRTNGEGFSNNSNGGILALLIILFILIFVVLLYSLLYVPLKYNRKNNKNNVGIIVLLILGFLFFPLINLVTFAALVDKNM